jgi:hypothetical protein
MEWLTLPARGTLSDSVDGELLLSLSIVASKILKTFSRRHKSGAFQCHDEKEWVKVE